MIKPNEMIFEVTEVVEGSYNVRTLDYSIFT